MSWGRIGDMLTVSICGGLAGALLGNVLLFYYVAVREWVMLDLRRIVPTLPKAVLRWLGSLPEGNILLLFFCVGIGLVAGILAYVWYTWRRRAMIRS